MINLRRCTGATSSRIIEEAIFGGYLFDHYGHFLAESIHRVWPALVYPEYKDLPVLFHSLYEGADLIPFMVDIFKYFGKDPERIIIINEPVKVTKLIVPTQGKLLRGPAMSPEYSKLFQQLLPMDPGAGYKNIYVSRSRYLCSGSYIGEVLVEETLAKAGVKVIFSEEHSIAELIPLYMNAERILLSEGSAIHALELCSGLTAKVMVICRRPSSRVDILFQAASAMVEGGMKYFDNKTILTSIATGPGGKPRLNRGSGLLDLNGLFIVLDEFYNVTLEKPTLKVMQDYMLIDLAKLAFSPSIELNNPQASAGQYLLLRQQVIDAGIFSDP